MVQYQFVEDISYYTNLKKCMRLVDTYVWDRTLFKNGRVDYEWGMSHSWFIGCDADICKRIKPTSYQDFYEKYVGEYASGVSLEPEGHGASSEEKSLRYCSGRTEVYLAAMAKKLRLEFEKNCPSMKGMFKPTDFYDYIVCHVIIETYDGYYREVTAQNILKDVSHDTIKFFDVDSKVDTQCGIDFVFSDESNKLFMVQVKPKSFFTSTREDTVRDRNNHICGKKKKALCDWVSSVGIDKFGNTNLLYMVYDKNGFITMNGGYLAYIEEWQKYLSK